MWKKLDRKHHNIELLKSYKMVQINKYIETKCRVVTIKASGREMENDYWWGQGDFFNSAISIVYAEELRWQSTQDYGLSEK